MHSRIWMQISERGVDDLEQLIPSSSKHCCLAMRHNQTEPSKSTKTKKLLLTRLLAIQTQVYSGETLHYDQTYKIILTMRKYKSTKLPEIGEAEYIVDDSDDIGRIKTLHHEA